MKAKVAGRRRRYALPRQIADPTGSRHALRRFHVYVGRRRYLRSALLLIIGWTLVTSNLPRAVKSYSIHEQQLKWFDVPLVAGGKAAVLCGDPSKAGTVVLRFKFPPNRQTQPHWHPYAEYTTILSGKIYYGEGSVFDASTPEIGVSGTFAVVPARQSHYVWTLDEEAVVQIQFEGPLETVFVDPADATNPE